MFTSEFHYPSPVPRTTVYIQRLPPLPELRRLFTADPEAGKLYWREGSRGRRKDAEAGSSAKHGRRSVMINGKHYLVSRVLWALCTGRDPGAQYIDHVNRDSTDDRLCNLRAVTTSENATNKQAYGATGHRGVYLHKPLRDGTPRYVVQICRALGRTDDGRYIRKTYGYGTFANLADAIARAAEVHAEWGMLQFLPTDNNMKKAG